jgi:hypothetical protein
VCCTVLLLISFTKLLYYFLINDFPVIAKGFVTPANSRIVGAISPSLPASFEFMSLSSNLYSLETNVNLTGAIVCAVQGSPFSSSICSALP